MPRNQRGQIRRRRDKAWEISVTLGVDQNGRQRRRYKTIHGTKRQALDALDRMLAEVSRGERVTYDERTVADLIKEWMKFVELADTTRADYENVIRLHLDHGLARTMATKVRTFDLDQMYRQLRAAGVGEHRIRRLHTILRRAFAQAVRWRWVDRNPVVDATPPRVRKAEIRPPSPAELRQAIAAAPATLKLWLRLAGATGARRGELCGLRWEDVEGLPSGRPSRFEDSQPKLRTGGKGREASPADTGYIWIRRSVAYTAKTGVYVKETKTHQIRRVPLDKATLAALEAHRVEQAELGRDKPECYLFSNSLDALTPWRPDSTSRLVRQVSGGTIHAHAIRHFVATQLTAGGVDVRTISERLGHERTSTTLDMYSHWAEGTGRAAADLIGDLLDG